MTDNTGGMGILAHKTRENVDKALAVIEEKVIKGTSIDLASLRPQISDKESFDKLLIAVNDAAQKNENLATFSDRIEKLGTNVKDVLVKVSSIITKI